MAATEESIMARPPLDVAIDRLAVPAARRAASGDLAGQVRAAVRALVEAGDLVPAQALSSTPKAE